MLLDKESITEEAVRVVGVSTSQRMSLWQCAFGQLYRQLGFQLYLIVCLDNPHSRDVNRACNNQKILNLVQDYTSAPSIQPSHLLLGIPASVSGHSKLSLCSSQTGRNSAS